MRERGRPGGLGSFCAADSRVESETKERVDANAGPPDVEGEVVSKLLV
jgi:hypothetical protein